MVNFGRSHNSDKLQNWSNSILVPWYFNWVKYWLILVYGIVL